MAVMRKIKPKLTPLALQALQRKLYAKAKQETSCCYALESWARKGDDLNRPNKRRMVKCARLGVKNIGKPCAGEPHARFDDGRQARVCSLLYPFANFFRLLGQVMPDWEKRKQRLETVLL